MAGIANDVKQIRQALYGREVREAIAHGIEQCYSDVTASKTVADTAAAAANTATQNAQTATQQANQARDNAQAVADGLVNQSITAINDAAAQQRQSVNDLGDQLKSYMSEHYSETITKAEAKANRSSVSTVKHAIGADGQLTLTDALNEPAKKMTIHLEPKQDLHGYDHPWVGGAGKNLLPLTLSELKAANTSGTWSGNNYALLGVTFQLLTDAGNNVTGIKVTGAVSGSGTNATLYLTNGYTDSSNYNGCIANGCPANGSGSTYSFRIGMGNGSWQTDQKDNGSGVTINAQSYTSLRPAITIFDGYSIASTGLVFYPMIRLATETDPTYESYSNICPIEGFDSVEVVGTGKNLFPPNNWANGSINTSGNNFASDYGIRQVDFHHIDPDTDYTFSASGASDDCALFVYDKNYNLSVRFQLWSISNGNGHYASFRTPSDAAYYKVRLTGSDYRPDRNMNMQLEYGTTATDYEPYQGNIVSINLVSSAGSTVYGGTVTVNEDGSGTLVVDRATVTLQNITSEFCAYSTNTHSFYLTPAVAPGMKIQPYTDAFTGISDRFKPYPGTPTWDKVTDYVIGFGSAQNFRFSIPGVTEVADALPYINGTQVAYYLNSPTTYQLTATQLQTLVGINHIWTDGTNIDLDYYADRYADIDKLYAALPKDTATGNPATFTDGADGLPLEKLEVAIEPKQDLHGYTHPWVGGAGKNLLGGFDDYSVYGIAIKDTVNGISISGTFASGQTQFSYTLLNKILPTGTYVVNGVNGTGGSSYQLVITGGGMSGTKYGATNNTTFTSDGTTAVIVRLFVYSSGSPYNVVVPWQIESGTTPTTYEPYSNICPISGFDKIDVASFGANILDISDSSKDFITTLPAGTYTLKRFNSSSDTQINSRIELLINNSYQYIISGEYDDGNIKVVSGDLGCGMSPSQMITTKKEYTLRFLGSTKNALAVHNATLMMVPGTTVPTSYEPYNGQTILPVSLRSISGSTVYGGKLVVNRDGSGELVVDRAMIDIGSLFWLTSSGTTYPYFRTSGLSSIISKPSANGVAANIKCEKYKTTSANEPYTGAATDCICVATTGEVQVYDTNYATVSAFTTAVTGTHLVYPLATPITYTLTAPQITTLLGTNRISCDAGKVTVTYHADPTLFITKKIAQALNA